MCYDLQLLQFIFLLTDQMLFDTHQCLLHDVRFLTSDEITDVVSSTKLSCPLVQDVALDHVIPFGGVVVLDLPQGVLFLGVPEESVKR
jgi:hypothetical protein